MAPGRWLAGGCPVLLDQGEGPLGLRVGSGWFGVAAVTSQRVLERLLGKIGKVHQVGAAAWTGHNQIVVQNRVQVNGLTL